MKNFLFVLALMFAFPLACFAGTAKIIDFKGEVSVKKNAASDWQDAKKGLALDVAAQVKTQAQAECTLAFDNDLKNIVTVKESSQIRIDSLKPGVVYLPQGRVFTLINNLKQVEKFQIKTPTAVAGARATGWETSHNNNSSGVMCFEDVVYVQGLDASGNVTGEQDLESGFGLEVGLGGRLGNEFELGDDARNEWNDFTGNVNNLTGGGEIDQRDGEAGSFMELRDEGRDTYREEIAQEQREEMESAREDAISEKTSSGGTETGGTGYSVTPGPY